MAVSHLDIYEGNKEHAHLFYCSKSNGVWPPVRTSDGFVGRLLGEIRSKLVFVVFGFDLLADEILPRRNCLRIRAGCFKTLADGPEIGL